MWSRKRNYDELAASDAENKRACFLQKRCQENRNQPLQPAANESSALSNNDAAGSKRMDCDKSKCVMPLTTNDECGKWVDGFKARVDDQYGRKVSSVSRSEIESIAVTTLQALLACNERTTITAQDGTLWNSGGVQYNL